MNENKLIVIDGETLMDMRLPPQRFCIQTLLPQGLSILSGASKIGKSWMALDMCLHIAKGEPMWNQPTTSGTVLYLCLEDNYHRIQDRLLKITDDVPSNIYFAISAKTLAEGLEDQIRDFVSEHRDTIFVAVDVFQMIRGGENENSYACDYRDMLQLKQIATELNIALLVVHHNRKLRDEDPFNMLSGTNGLLGAADAGFVLLRSTRNQSNATLHCTGRDIESREIDLNFDKDTCTWTLISDSMKEPMLLLPKEMAALITFMRETVSFSGTNADFVDAFKGRTGCDVNAKGLKQMMNKWRYMLEEHGVYFRSYRSNGLRLLDISFSDFSSDVSASNDGNISGGEISVTCDPCVPVGEREPHSAAVSAVHTGSEETLEEGATAHRTPQIAEFATEVGNYSQRE